MCRTMKKTIVTCFLKILLVTALHQYKITNFQFFCNFLITSRLNAIQQLINQVKKLLFTLFLQDEN